MCDSNALTMSDCLRGDTCNLFAPRVRHLSCQGAIIHPNERRDWDSEVGDRRTRSRNCNRSAVLQEYAKDRSGLATTCPDVEDRGLVDYQLRIL